MVSAVSNSDVSVNRLIAAATRSPLGVRRATTSVDAHRVDPASESRAIGKSELTEDERQQVEDLKQRDAEVRRHEQAHKAAAGTFARGGPTFEYETGPDGKQYAVGGEVQLDVSTVPGDPQATIDKMQQVQQAATAAAEPSSTDRQVAAKAAALEREARIELTRNADAGNFDPGSSAPGNKAASRNPVARLHSIFNPQPAASPGRFIDVRV